MPKYMHDATRNLADYQLVDELVHRSKLEADGGKESVCRMLACAWLYDLKGDPRKLEGIGDWLKEKFDQAVDDVIEHIIRDDERSRAEAALVSADPGEPDEIPF